MRLAAAASIRVALTTLVVMVEDAASESMRPVKDLKAALEVAKQALAEKRSRHDWVIIESQTLERPFGWVFFYSTRKHVETGDWKFAVPGNGPLIVERSNGATHFLPTAPTPKKAIELFEEAWRKRPQP